MRINDLHAMSGSPGTTWDSGSIDVHSANNEKKTGPDRKIRACFFFVSVAYRCRSKNAVIFLSTSFIRRDQRRVGR